MFAKILTNLLKMMVVVMNEHLQHFYCKAIWIPCFLIVRQTVYDFKQGIAIAIKFLA